MCIGAFCCQIGSYILYECEKWMRIEKSTIHLKQYGNKYGLIIYLTSMNSKCCLIKYVYEYDKIYFKLPENKTSVKVIE